MLAGGGALLQLATERGVPRCQTTFRGQPRAALGHSLMPLIRIAEHTGLLGDQSATVDEAYREMSALRDALSPSVAETCNQAKQLARCLLDSLPVVVGAEHLSEAARRWRTQFNENSKSWALDDELSEGNHNSIVGFGLPTQLVSRLYAIFLDAPTLHPRIRQRIRLTGEALARAGVRSETIEARGQSSLSQVLTAVLFGDFVTYYLALLNGVDPTPVEAIERLKAELVGS